MNEYDHQILRKRLLLKGELLAPLSPGIITASTAPDPLREVGFTLPPEIIIAPLTPDPPLPLIGLPKLYLFSKSYWLAHTCQSNK